MMSFYFPTVFYRTRPASQGTTRRFTATIRAVLYVFCGRSDFSPMHLLVTPDTKSKTVIDVECVFWKLREWFDVVCMKFFSALAAYPTSVIIPSINLFAPYFQFTAHLAASCLQRLPAFPVSRVCANSQNSGTVARAKTRTFITAIKLYAARIALARHWWVANRPTFFRAVFTNSVLFRFKRFSANGAIVSGAFAPMLASNFVVTIIAASLLLSKEWVKLFSANGADFYLFQSCTHALDYSTLSPAYCAVILERMSTAFPALDIHLVDIK